MTANDALSIVTSDETPEDELDEEDDEPHGNIHSGPRRSP